MVRVSYITILALARVSNRFFLFFSRFYYNCNTVWHVRSGTGFLSFLLSLDLLTVIWHVCSGTGFLTIFFYLAMGRVSYLHICSGSDLQSFFFSQFPNYNGVISLGRVS